MTKSARLDRPAAPRLQGRCRQAVVKILRELVLCRPRPGPLRPRRFPR